ncbi:MAG: D-alanyl-D-alanine carboxypeptidase/D-alanyl-D-alanine-endopeptidase [Halofilum sp. (in: g-proteobacteria)]
MRRSPGRVRRIAYGLALLLTACSLPVTASGTNLQWLDALRELDRNHARVSALVVKLDDLRTIAALNPDRPLIPASVSKLFVSAGALKQFCPDHRFVTRFGTTGTMTDGVLHGDLVFVGGGDPALDTQDLRSLVLRLKAAGVRRVTGSLILDNGLFGPLSCTIKDRCEARTRASHSYSAPLSSVGVDFSTVEVTVYPGSETGDEARATLTPAGLPGYIIDNQVTTGGPNARPRLSAWRESIDGRDILHLRGEVPANGGHYRFYRAAGNAVVHSRRVLETLLADAQIEVEGKATVRTVDETKLSTLAAIRSDRLDQMLIAMQSFSNNYMADTLTLDIAAARGPGSLTLPRAAEQLEQLARQAILETYPKHSSEFTAPFLTSGSGLSVDGRLSARHVIALLKHMYHDNALFPAFYGTMPVPISAVSSTLKHGNEQWLTRIVAKTGTLTEPMSVRSLAGYFRFRNGDFGAFAIIINGTEKRPIIGFHSSVTAYQKDIESILAGH